MRTRRLREWWKTGRWKTEQRMRMRGGKRMRRGGQRWRQRWGQRSGRLSVWRT